MRCGRPRERCRRGSAAADLLAKVRLPRVRWPRLLGAPAVPQRAHHQTTALDDAMEATRLRFEPHSVTLSSAPEVDVLVPVGIDSLIDTIFRHDPPTPGEMERAIDMVEDALMATRLRQGERGELVTAEPMLRALPGFNAMDARLTLDQVEALFQRLASASLGDPSALADTPIRGRAAAALLILRECMHHLGYVSVRLALAT